MGAIIHKLRCLKVSLILFIILMGIGRSGVAQHMEFGWSDKYRFTNKKTGFFTEYVGTSHTTIYLLLRNISKSKPYDNAKLKLMALNKKSLVHDTVVALKGFPENEGNEALLKSLDYVTSVVTDEGIFVFWRKLSNTDSTRHEEIYAQTLRKDMKPGVAIKKVYEFTHDVENQASIFDPSRCVIAANSALGRLVLGTESFDNGQLSFRYVTLDGSLSASPEKTFPLPQKLEKLPESIASEYELRKNGLVYVRSTVKYTKEELEGKDLSHPRTYPSLTIANMNSAQHYNLEIRSENKTMSDFSYQDIAGKTRVIGFFGDFEKDTTGIDDQGIFYADIDDESLSSTGLNYAYFERSIKNRLLPKKARKKRNAELSTEEILNTRFDTEHIESMPDSSTVLFFTMEYNTKEKTSRSDLSGRNVYSTQFTFKKSNVFAMRLTDEGEVLWARGIDRTASYKGTDLVDVQVVFKHGKFIVLYGNENPKLKSHRKKKLRHWKEEIEYATFDPKSGRAKIYTTSVNERKTLPRNKRYLEPRSAIAIDGRFYFHKMRVRQNPLWTAANVVCFPTLYYTILTGNTKLGKGDFTVMTVKPGKRPKRKR